MSSEDIDRATLAIFAARQNIALIRTWANGRVLSDLRSDTQVRYAIERAFIAIDAAMHDIPPKIIAEHRLPARLVAGFRNALAHTYDDILDERVILTIREICRNWTPNSPRSLEPWRKAPRSERGQPRQVALARALPASMGSRIDVRHLPLLRPFHGEAGTSGRRRVACAGPWPVAGRRGARAAGAPSARHRFGGG